MTWDEFSPRRYQSAVAPAASLLALTAFALWRVEANLGDLVKGLGKGLEMLGLFVPPEWGAFSEMVEPALVTVLLALTATPIGAVLALVFGLAGSARRRARRWRSSAACRKS